MSRSGGGPEGFGLLSLAFPSNIMTLQNTRNNTTEKKKKAGASLPIIGGGIILSAELFYQPPMQRAADN